MRNAKCVKCFLANLLFEAHEPADEDAEDEEDDDGLVLQLLVKDKHFSRALLHREVGEQLQLADVSDRAFTDDFSESSGNGFIYGILGGGDDEVGRDGGAVEEGADLPLRLYHSHTVHIRLGTVVGHRQHHYGEDVLVVVVLHHFHTLERCVSVHPFHKHRQFGLVVVEALGTSA